MTTHSKRLVAISLIVALFAPVAAFSQYYSQHSEIGLKANGTASIQKKPTHLRLYVELQAKGKTLKEALAKLKERREAATVQLESLKADKKSIVFGKPGFSIAQATQRQQLEAMMIAQMRNRGKKVPKDFHLPQTVVVTASLTAQWPLESDDYEKVLIKSQELQEKVKAADLAGVKDKDTEKRSPEEEELEEEAKESMDRSEQANLPGQPQLVFVATITKAEREKAMAEACAAAKTKAAELAKAAGIELGVLIGLSGECGGVNFGGLDSSERSAILRRISPQESEDEEPEKSDEAISGNPSTLQFRTSVTVQYKIGK